MQLSRSQNFARSFKAQYSITPSQPRAEYNYENCLKKMQADDNVGMVSTHAVLHVVLVPEKGMAGSGLAVIPLDLPGISKDKPLDKMGQRPLNQGSIIFQDARIPRQYMVLNEEAAMNIHIYEKP